MKKIILLSLLISVFTGTYILGIVFSGVNNSNRVFEQELLSNFNLKNITEIIISDDENVSIIKEGDNWFVNNNNMLIPSLNDKIEDLLTSIDNLKVGKKITSNKSKYSQFGLNDDQGTTIIVSDKSSNIYSIKFGSTNEIGNQYVKLSTENIVYSTENITNNLPNSTNGWYDLKVLSDIKRESNIQSIKFKFEEYNVDYSIIKTQIDNDLGWKISNEETVIDQMKVDIYTNFLLTLNAVDYIVADEVTDKGSLTITLFDGNEIKLEIGRESSIEDNYIATIAGTGRFFTLSEYSLHKIFVLSSEFVKI